MRKHLYSKLGLIACLAVLAASIQVRADMAWASGALADMYVAKTEASAAMAAAPGGGEAALKAAQERVATIETAITDAEAAYSKLEAAGGDDDAATDALKKARQQALGEDAVPEPGSDPRFTLPNIYDVPWETDGLRELKDKQQEINDASSSNGGDGFSERDYEDDGTPT